MMTSNHTENEEVYIACDDCGTELSITEYEENNGLCTKCRNVEYEDLGDLSEFVKEDKLPDNPKQKHSWCFEVGKRFNKDHYRENYSALVNELKDAKAEESGMVDKNMKRILADWEDDVLKYMNRHYCALDKAQYLQLAYDDQGKLEDWDMLSKGHFINKMENTSMLFHALDKLDRKTPQFMMERTTLAKWWLEQKGKHEKEKMDFYPAPSPSHIFNLYRGPKLGREKALKMSGIDYEEFFEPDIEPEEMLETWAMDACPTILEHVKEVMANGNEEMADYLLNWCAHIVQKPHQKTSTAIILKSEEGAGKGIFMKLLQNIIGHHFKTIHRIEDITGRWTNQLADAILVFGDDLNFQGQEQKISARMKTLVTEDTHTIEAKYTNAVQVASYANFVLASNDRFTMPVGNKSRRYVVYDLNNKWAGVNTEDHDVLVSEFEEQKNDFASYLYLRDISGFDPRKLPIANTVQNDRLHSMNTAEAWIHQFLLDGHIGDFLLDPLAESEFIETKELQKAYTEFCKQEHGRKKVGFNEVFKSYLCKPDKEVARAVTYMAVHDHVKWVADENMARGRRAVKEKKFKSISSMKKDWCKYVGNPDWWDNL